MKKMKKHEKRWKLAVCWTLITSLSMQMVIPGFAGVRVYDHEHDEDCYTEIVECLHEHDEDCYLDNDLDEDATPSDADEREPENCPHICDEESGCITWVLDCPYEQDEELATDSNASQVIISAEYVQELIDALPDAEDITEENADEVIKQLEMIDDVKILLTDEELELLDFTRYEAAAAALGSVYEVATLWSVEQTDFEVIGGEDYEDYSVIQEWFWPSGSMGVGNRYMRVTGLLIKTNTPLTIKNKNPDTATTNKIVVEKDVSANVTLAGVNIDVSETGSVSAFEIEKDSTGSVVITLADGTNNILKSGKYSAALQKEGTNGSLTIQCEHSDEENGHSCTDECGELQTVAIYGAGIGSGNSSGSSGNVSNIRINGGVVTANGDVGIGSGYAESNSGNVSNISITGGVITANGGVGIGSGSADLNSGNISNISITGGIVTASGDEANAGIGSGYAGMRSGNVSNIRITEGVVTASAGEFGTGIGNGYGGIYSGTVSNISITGGSVKTSSIGCTPDNGNGENVYLLTLANPNSESVYIDGEEYLPVNHLAADESDTNLYVYLTGTTHTVKIGDAETHYHFDEETHTFAEAVFASTYTSDKDGHWYTCANATCEIKGGYEKHNLNENGICGACGYDGTAPTGEISIGTNKWNQFLSELTFGVFFKESQTVSITANDNSGKAVTIEYLLSDQELTEKALQTAKFTAYNGSFTISPDNRCIIYAKLTDSAGNVAYINTTGIVLDGTAPVISGIENGKIYCEPQTVTINETNLASVTVNHTSVELDKNGQFLLSPAEGVQNIIVKDQAGNQTEISVTVNDGHTPKADDGDCTTAVLCQYCEEVAINAKTHDFSEKWNFDSSGHWHVCENAGCKATDTKIPHSGTDDGNCTTEVKCKCGYVITEANTDHTWSEWISDGNGKHFRKCLTEGCTIQTPLSDCNDGDKDHLCDLCKASLSDHTGGNATCTDKAVCEYCGEEYGDIDPSNHSQIQHTEALKATVSKEGHIEYWYCAGCGKYYSDEALTQEIHQEDTVIPKKENPHSDEEGYSENSGILNDVNRIFTDVAETDAYYNDIMFVYEHGLMSGTGTGTFTPNGNTTCLQLAEILYQMEGRPAITEAEKAAAQSQSSGYGPGMTASYDAVIWAQKAGIYIEATQPLTREQLASMLYRYAQYKGYDVAVGENTNILSYHDFDQISEAAVLAVQWAVGSGILKDNGNGYLNPKGIVTRAQLAGVLHDFIAKYDLTAVVSETGIVMWVKKKDEIKL